MNGSLGKDGLVVKLGEEEKKFSICHLTFLICHWSQSLSEQRGVDALSGITQIFRGRHLLK